MKKCHCDFVESKKNDLGRVSVLPIMIKVTEVKKFLFLQWKGLLFNPNSLLECATLKSTRN